MRRNSSSVDLFVAAVRRRMIVVRTAECAATGSLVTTLLAAPLGAILIYRGEAAMLLVLVAMGLGMIAGVLWALKGRPTILGAALEVDRQLGLHEMLSTV